MASRRDQAVRDILEERRRQRAASVLKNAWLFGESTTLVECHRVKSA
jgi:hypothetical protein